MISTAWASEAEGGGGHATLAISAVINFLLLTGLLYFLLRKPVKKTLHDRHNVVKSAAEEAERLRQEAVQMVAEYEEKLARLDAEIAKILKEAHAEGEIERKKILERAEVAAQRVRDNAKRASERELAETKIRLQQEVLGRAAEEAAKLLKEKVTRQDHLTFTRGLIRHLEGMDGPRS